MTQNTLPLLLALSLTMALSSAFGQNERPKPAAADIAQAPWWAQQMYAEHPNVFDIDSAYLLWRKEYPAADSYHTRYYKHWRRNIGSAMDEAGHPIPENLAQSRSTFQHWMKLRSETKHSRSVQWENIGPFFTWREGQAQAVSWQVNVYALDQSLSNPDVLLAGTENGAVFKSVNHGLSWQPVSDTINTSGGIRAVAVLPSNSEVFFAADNHSVFRSDDGGSTWAEVLFLANLKTTAFAFSPSGQTGLLSSEKGLYRSTDAGLTWTAISSEKCWDVKFSTGDPNTAFALVSDTQTKLCKFLKSTDAGASWHQMTNGWIDPAANSLSDNNDGGAKLALTDADPNRIYAVLLGQYNDGVNDNNYLGVYRSDDGGESWTLPNANANGGPGGPYAGNHTCLVTFWFNDNQRYPNNSSEYNQGFYNLAIDASDSDPDLLLLGFLNLFKSTDGAATFERWGGYGGGPGWQHPDIQDIDINGPDFWVSSDGGINLYTPSLNAHSSMANGLAGSDFWGFDGGWNEDVMTGGRYHNGNTATIYGSYAEGEFIRLGGAEATTGYVHPAGGRKVMHSDISPKVLPTVATGPSSGFSFTQYPNEGYAGNNENSSEIEPDPRCYNHLYMGVDNTLQKSTDAGLSWTTLFTFGNDQTDIITGIEVSRSNPAVLYVVQNAGSSVVWRSDDGGLSFTALPQPPGPTSGAFIALDPEDENHLWLAWNKGSSNSNKVFESSDGGNSWTNISSTVLNGHHIEQLIHIGGTANGLYLATNYGVFYRSENTGDWQPHADGLPARAKSNRLVPFYAKGKVRLATYGRGVWQSDFFEQPDHIIVQPTVDKLVSFCARDTFYFDDYSMVNHANAQWQWNFDPAPLWVSDAGVRNPKVVFGTPGTYTATMTLNGISKSLLVEVGNGCEPEGTPGMALTLNGSTDEAIASGNLNLNTNHLTIAAWVKADPDQPDRAAVVFARGGSTTAGLGFSNGTRLSYHWNDGQWWWDPGLIVPPNVWTHIALVVSPDSAVIYLNGTGLANFANHAPEAFDTPLHIGRDPSNNSRRFKGLVDEVCIWNKALTREELRERMHLTQNSVNDTTLVAYYQFNEDQGPALDRVGVHHVALVAAAGRSSSSGPFGQGASSRMSVFQAGAFPFGETKLTMDFSEGAVLPGGELVVTRIDLEPNLLPAPLPHSLSYYIVDNYGQNFFIDAPALLSFGKYGDIPASAHPADYQLYLRGANDDAHTWTLVDVADEIETGNAGSVSFAEGNTLEFFGQLIVMNEETTATNELGFSATTQSDGSVLLEWLAAVNTAGQWFRLDKSTDGQNFSLLTKLPAGVAGGTRLFKSVDPAPRQGTNWYRLTQLDARGLPLRVKTAQVTVAALPGKWSVFPNPVSSGAVLHVASQNAGLFRFRLFGPQGKRVLSAQGQGQAFVPLPALPPGAYGYEISDGKQRFFGMVVLK